MTLMILGMVLPWLLLGLGFWLGYQLLLQNGRVVLRLEMLEKQIRQLGALLAGEPDSPQGLPVGTAAPEFELPDLAGQPQKLSQFRGRRLLLIFFNPKCGYCVKMAPDLATLGWPGQSAAMPRLEAAGASKTQPQPPHEAGETPEQPPVVVVISTGTPEDNRRLIEEHNLHCPILLQKEMEVATQYQA